MFWLELDLDFVLEVTELVPSFKMCLLGAYDRDIKNAVVSKTDMVSAFMELAFWDSFVIPREQILCKKDDVTGT